jgi:hypothetical protein
MTGIATTKDWLKATEAAGMKLSAFNPSFIMLELSTSHSTGFNNGDNPILEMRTARRSLREKAREGMSDFEREYPW